jgi:hypothetical protein
MMDGELDVTDFVIATLGLVLSITFALLAFSLVIPWWVAAIFTPAGGLMAAAVFAWGHKSYINQLEITEQGVTRRFGRKFRAKKQEAVTWQDLSKVEIETTDAGPLAEDFFYMLHGKTGGGVVVGVRLAVEHNLLHELQSRLPDLDKKTVALASGCTENRSFHIWPTGSGLN